MFTVAHSAATAHDLCPHRVVRRDDSRRSTRRLPSLEPRAPITGKATVRRSGSSAWPHRETRPWPRCDARSKDPGRPGAVAGVATRQARCEPQREAPEEARGPGRDRPRHVGLGHRCRGRGRHHDPLRSRSAVSQPHQAAETGLSRCIPGSRGQRAARAGLTRLSPAAQSWAWTPTTRHLLAVGAVERTCAGLSISPPPASLAGRALFRPVANPGLSRGLVSAALRLLLLVAAEALPHGR